MASSSFSGASAASDHHSLNSHSPLSARPSRHPWSDVVRGAGTPDLDGSPSSPTPASATAPLAKLTDHAAAADGAASPSAAANPQPPTPDDLGNGSNNGNSPVGASDRGKKPAWKRPSNGAIESGPVMGAASWPLLSESAKASPKSSPSDAGKPLIDASAYSPTTGSLIHDSSPKANENNFNPTAPTRQRSMKRGGNGRAGDDSSSQVANGLVVQRPSQTTADKQSVTELSPRDHSGRNTTWTGGSGPQDHHGSGDHHRGYAGNHRRGNNGGGGGGSPHHGNYGSRRDHDRGGHNVYHQRGVNGKDAHIHQRGARPYFRPSQPVTPPFMPPVRPFGGPVVYPDMPPPMIYVAPQPLPEPFRPLPYVAHPAAPPPMFFPVIDPQRAILLKQIDYYFSNENLCKDIYLRKNMDEQGWVPISLIAGFNRAKEKLYCVLLGIRAKLAKENGIAPYAICGDETIKRLTKIRPCSKARLANIDDVNQVW